MLDKQQFQVGSHTVPDPPAALTIKLGFKPSYVKAVNINDLVLYEHFSGMDADSSLNTANHDTTQLSVNAADGITLTDDGFTLGSDICDTAADVVRWIAAR